jgi:hypothetical protein
MKNPSRILAITASVLVATPLIAGPPPRTPDDTFTFTLTVTPSRDLYNWGLGVIQETSTSGIYTFDFLSGFPDLIGVFRDGPALYEPYTAEVTMTRPNGVGNFGYFIIGRYNPEAPAGEETGVTIGMNPGTATTYINEASEWTVPFPGILEANVYSDLADNWATSASAGNNTFLGQLFAIATQSANAMGSVGGPTSLNLTLVTFSQADQGGSALLSFNPIPEASTVASGLALFGVAGWMSWRRSRQQT